MTIQQMPPSPSPALPVLQEDKAFARPWGGWFRRLYQLINTNFVSQQTQLDGLANGQTVTIPTAALTGTGTNGSLTFTNGVLTSHVNPT